MQEKMNLEERQRAKEVDSARQRHAETINEIDQMFVRILNVFSCINRHQLFCSTYEDKIWLGQSCGTAGVHHANNLSSFKHRLTSHF